MQNAPATGHTLHTTLVNIPSTRRVDECEDVGNADDVQNNQHQKYRNQNADNT